MVPPVMMDTTVREIAAVGRLLMALIAVEFVVVRYMAAAMMEIKEMEVAAVLKDTAESIVVCPLPQIRAQQ